MLLGSAPTGALAIGDAPNAIITPITFGPIPVFPMLPQGFPIKVSPSWDTTIGTTKSLREMRVAQRQEPLWDIEILFEELRDQTQNQTIYAPFSGFTQYQQLVSLWLMMYGQTQVFAFDCLWDDSRSEQLLGTGDGITTAFFAVRTWGQSAQATTAVVGMINEVFDVFLDGSPVDPSEYTIGRNFIEFNVAPTNGQEITMTFTYYYLCRFVEDEQDFEEFEKNRWTLPSLKFRSVNWP